MTGEKGTLASRMSLCVTWDVWEAQKGYLWASGRRVLKVWPVWLPCTPPWGLCHEVDTVKVTVLMEGLEQGKPHHTETSSSLEEKVGP